MTARVPLVLINGKIQGLPSGDWVAGGAAGAAGLDGAAATVSVGTTTTGAAGSSASVTNSGTSSAAVLNFTIPKGDTGATGATGAAGGMVQLAQIVGASSQTTIDFTSISGSYSALKVLWFGRDTASGTAGSNLRVRFNNDSTAANYTSSSRSGSQNGTAFATVVASSTGGVEVGFMANDGNTTGMFSAGEVTIVGYASASIHKRVHALANHEDGTSNGLVASLIARWKSTAAITRVTFTTDGTAFKDGSTFTLYGIP